jgi:ADP-ribose pyrophosphatase YjhB (NUDIX family)
MVPSLDLKVLLCPYFVPLLVCSLAVLVITRVLLTLNTRTRTMGDPECDGIVDAAGVVIQQKRTMDDPECNGIVEAAGVMILQKHKDGDSVILVGIPEKKNGPAVFGEPGGLVDLNNNGFPIETPRQAAAREAAEESRGVLDMNPNDLIFLGYLKIPNMPGHHYALYGFEVEREFKCRSFHSTSSTQKVLTHTEAGEKGWNESTAFVRVFLGTLRFVGDHVKCDNFGTPEEIPVTKRFQACVRKSIATGFLSGPRQANLAL